MATGRTHTQDLGQGDPNSAVCADWGPNSLTSLLRMVIKKPKSFSLVFDILEAYLGLHMHSKSWLLLIWKFILFPLHRFYGISDDQRDKYAKKRFIEMHRVSLEIQANTLSERSI